MYHWKKRQITYYGYDYAEPIIVPIFCNDATLLWEFESDKIWFNEFE